MNAYASSSPGRPVAVLGVGRDKRLGPGLHARVCYADGQCQDMAVGLVPKRLLQAFLARRRASTASSDLGDFEFLAFKRPPASDWLAELRDAAGAKVRWSLDQLQARLSEVRNGPAPSAIAEKMRQAPNAAKRAAEQAQAASQERQRLADNALADQQAARFQNVSFFDDFMDELKKLLGESASKAIEKAKPFLMVAFAAGGAYAAWRVYRAMTGAR